MAVKKRWLALALIIVALLASLEAMPRSMVVQLAVPGTAAFVSNTGPYGTSMLAQKLESMGYKIQVIGGPGQLEQVDLGGYTDLVYLVVAPTNITATYAQAIARTLTSIAGAGHVRVHLVVFDELGLTGENVLARQVEAVVCPQSGVYATIRTVTPRNTYATILFSDGRSLATGLTSRIDFTVQTGPGTFKELAGPSWTMKPSLPYSVQGVWTVEAAVFPSPAEKPLWVPAAAACVSGEGSVVLVADSTIAVNMAAQNDTAYLDEDIRLITLGVPPRNRTLVVVDGSLYTDLSHNIMVRLHPSFLLLSLASAYRLAEARGLQFFQALGIKGLLTMLSGAVLMLATWGASRISSERTPKKAGKRLEPSGPSLGRIARGLMGVFGSYSRLERACKLAGQTIRGGSVRELALSIPDPAAREVAVGLLTDIEESCRVPFKQVLSYIPLWGGRARRVEEDLDLLLSILRLRSPFPRGETGEG